MCGYYLQAVLRALYTRTSINIALIHTPNYYEVLFHIQCTIRLLNVTDLIIKECNYKDK